MNEQRAEITNFRSKIAAVITTTITMISPLSPALTNASEATPSTADRFDLIQPLEESRPLGATLRISEHRFGPDLRARRFEGSIYLYTVFQFDYDSTQFFYKSAFQQTFHRLRTFRGALHIPLRKLSLAYGGSWTWSTEEREDHSGPGTYLSVDFRPVSYLTMNFVLENLLLDKQLDHTSTIEFFMGDPRLQVGLGYRWLDIGEETLSGPNISIKARF